MVHGLYKVVVQCVLYSCFVWITARAAPDSAGIPAALQQQLHNLQQNDDLEKWVYARIDYVDASPVARIGFLMQTQQAAWRTYRNYDERLAWFNLLILQGYYQLQTGNILSSVNAYEAALEFYEAYPLPGVDLIGYVLKPLGNNYTRLADYPAALYIHNKTLTLARQQHNVHEIAATYSNMAICARWMERLNEAATYVQHGLSQLPVQPAVRGMLLSTWADILTEQGRFDTARIVLASAARYFTGHINDTANVARRIANWQIAARIDLLEGKGTNALKNAQMAGQWLDRYFPLTHQRDKAKVEVLTGNAWQMQRNPREALLHYQRALRLLLPAWQPTDDMVTPPDSLLYSENTLTDALAAKAHAWLLLGNRQAALQHYLTVFSAAAKLRSVFYYTESKLKELYTLQSRAANAMHVAYALWNDTHQAQYKETMLLIAEWSKAQLLAEERSIRSGEATHARPADSTSRKIKRMQDAIVYYQHEIAAMPANTSTSANTAMRELLQATEYELSLLMKKTRGNADNPSSPGNPTSSAISSSATMLTSPQLHRIYDQLPAGLTVLEFFEGSDSSYVLEVDRRGIQDIRVIPFSYRLLDTARHFMQRWFARGPSAMMNAPEVFYRECHALYKDIFGNYAWNKDNRYLLIPDGAFSYLPFDALLTNDEHTGNYTTWPWLLKTAALSQAYSLLTWQQQQTSGYANQHFTGFFVSKGAGTTQPSLSVAQEYALLHQQVKGAYFVDTAATWAMFNQSVHQAGVLHISSHAVSSNQDSLPYLQLYDQPFYLFDLRYQHFVPSLVVLGACKTADGTWLEGEGVNSLSRGFTAAGAGGVVSGLWNVNDEAAIGINVYFYRHLQQGKDAAQALRDARLQWLEEHREENVLQLPYYWAGLVYSGHLQTIPFMQQDASHTGMNIAIGIGLAVLLLIYIWIKLRRWKP